MGNQLLNSSRMVEIKVSLEEVSDHTRPQEVKIIKMLLLLVVVMVNLLNLLQIS